jgi:hypothetical protein
VIVHDSGPDATDWQPAAAATIKSGNQAFVLETRLWTIAM